MGFPDSDSENGESPSTAITNSEHIQEDNKEVILLSSDNDSESSAQVSPLLHPSQSPTLTAQSKQQAQPARKRTVRGFTSSGSDTDYAPHKRRSRHEKFEYTALDRNNVKTEDGETSEPADISRVEMILRAAWKLADKIATASDPSFSQHVEQGDDREMDEDDSDFYEDYEYDANYLLGGEFEELSLLPRTERLDVNYKSRIDASYQASTRNALMYQTRILQERSKTDERLQRRSNSKRHVPKRVGRLELEFITNAVADTIKTLKPVDWEDIARHGLNKMQLAIIKSYQCATTFNYSSASVVDMAMKVDGSKVRIAIANVATQDEYNRAGNLVFCEVENQICKHMRGHEYPATGGLPSRTATVKDVKLSYSKNFMYSGSDDGKTKIWDADDGSLLHTIHDYENSHVNRLAVIEDSIYHEDVFASCSSHGGINIYKIDNEAGVEGQDNMTSGNDYQHGQIVFYDANASNGAGDIGFRSVCSKTVPRSVSCLSFSSSGQFLICGTSGRTLGEDDERGDGIVRVFQTKAAKEVQSVLTQHSDVNLVDFSPCENYIISCSHTNEIAVFDRRFLPPPKTYKPLHVFKHQDAENDESNVGITSALWWPTFRQGGLGCSSQVMIMSGGGDGCVRLWDVRRATEDAHVWSMDGRQGPVARLTASPNMEHLVIGADTGAVSIFTVDQGLVSQYENKPMRLYEGDREDQDEDSDNENNEL
ncbi:hypothetical protein BGZ94_006650 [Podila epigama]|nr:hypothetical protein BGZ94_006650 [Podila epigama]